VPEPPEPPPEPPLPPVPPPELVQLAMLAAKIINNASKTIPCIRLLRRFQPIGSRSKPQMSGIALQMRGPLESAEEAEFPVDTVTDSLPATPAFKVSVVGLKMQRASEGSVPQANVKTPDEPLRGVNTIVNTVLWPFDTDWDPEPEIANVKSKPIPFRTTEALVEIVALVAVRLPDCSPAAVGTNSTPVVQDAPGASVAAQVLLTSWKPVGTESARLVRATSVPVLVMVTVEGVLVWPTPIIWKSIEGGVIWRAATTAPVPLRFTVAPVIMEGEDTFNVPLTGPVPVGVNTTPTVQDEPGSRVTVQLFCVKANSAVMESAS